MIDLYSSTSPNVQKIYLALEELGLPYTIHTVNVHKGEQYSDAFGKLNPNRKVPVITDHDGPGGKPITIFESGAILLYLAEKTGRLMPTDPAARWEAVQWLMIQVASLGPMFGQFVHFHRFKTDDPYGAERYTSEARRLYDLLEQRLGTSAYLGGADYTIVDVATWPWIRTLPMLFAKIHPFLDLDHPGHPNLTRWFRTVEAREAVQRAVAVIAGLPQTMGQATPDDIDRYMGRGAYKRTLAA